MVSLWLVHGCTMDSSRTMKKTCEMLKQTSWVQDIEADPSMKHAAAALALAFFLDHMWQERPSKRVAASPWYETASSLACKMLAAHVSSAPQVSDLYASLSASSLHA